MRILMLFVILFCEITFAKTFTLTGSTTQTGPVSFINKRLVNGYSVYCDFTVVATSATMKIELGNINNKLSEVTTNLVITTTGIHGIEIETFSHQARLVIDPVGGSFTAVCNSNQ